jgi:hypothetical protein
MTRLRHALLVAAAVSCAARAEVPLEVCDSPSFQTVLHASNTRFDARAVWLDRRLVKWPGVAPDGIFRLYHSASGAIAAPVGHKVSGAAGALTLDQFKGQVPVGPSARFKYLSAGPVLSVRDADLPRLAELHRQQLLLVQEKPDGTVRAATRVQVAGALDDIYAQAASLQELGAGVSKKRTTFKLWAPTAQQVAVCVYVSGSAPAGAVHQMQFDAATGVWGRGPRRATSPANITSTPWTSSSTALDWCATWSPIPIR